MCHNAVYDALARRKKLFECLMILACIRGLLVSVETQYTPKDKRGGFVMILRLPD